MPLKFAANLSTMYREEVNLADRYQLAKGAGFKAVECQFPYDYPLDLLEQKKRESGLQHILINSFPGNLSAGDLGVAAKPHYEGEFASGLDLTISYAKALDCKLIHIMAGVTGIISDAEAEEAYIRNLSNAAERLEKEGIVAVIEPICKEVKANYFLNSFEKGVQYITKIGSNNLKLLLDVFHLQMMAGNLTNNIKNLLPLTGHVQISQAPKRDEINAPGEINYPYILKVLEDLHYDGWIGLEYIPSGSTKDSLKWIQQYGYTL